MDQDWKSSSEMETDNGESSGTSSTTSGTGRSYECVFCKRGFTTAQALGGHMNIHRKHRATKPDRSSNKYNNKGSVDDDHDEIDHFSSSYRVCTPILQSYPPQHYYPFTTINHHQEVHIDYQSFNTGPQQFRQEILTPFGRNLGPSLMVNEEKGRNENDLDLELRLGHGLYK